jgi:hypothetical protein
MPSEEARPMQVLRQFGASPYKAAPKDLPSSSAQHGAIRTFLTQRLTGTSTLPCTPQMLGQKGTFLLP